MLVTAGASLPPGVYSGICSSCPGSQIPSHPATHLGNFVLWVLYLVDIATLHDHECAI